MKVIFSRKGFDSSAGGVPSPIGKGLVQCLPIPASNRSQTTYGDLGLGEVVNQVTKGRLTSNSLCHHDPMFENGRCAFGQCGAAQGHLANQGVDVGDVFLFFGLFAHEELNSIHHRIFGYQKIEQVLSVNSNANVHNLLSDFSQPHPHTIGKWESNNTIYLGKGKKCSNAKPSLRLSVQDGLVSHWHVPGWLKSAGLTYHKDPSRWLGDNQLRTVGRGQEFVTDITGNRSAQNWLRRIIRLIGESSKDEKYLS